MKNLNNLNEIRKPAVSGQFYNSNPTMLKKQIKKCFLSDLGPGSLPKKTKNNNENMIAGAISPHAGYDFSGPAAAHTFNAIAESEPVETYILLGLSHMGLPSCTSLKDWETPLGIAKNDIEFSKELSKSISTNESAHEKEHSIEVQIPFLQFINPKAKIVPIITSHDQDYNKIANAITNTAEKLKRKIMIIASSDFTHYGPSYNYIPFTKNIKENMYSLDKGAIDAILTTKTPNFIDYLKKTNTTICGQMPIAVIMEIMKNKKAKLLKYYTSGDILGDYENAVGYASIIFK